MENFKEYFDTNPGPFLATIGHSYVRIIKDDDPLNYGFIEVYNTKQEFVNRGNHWLMLIKPFTEKESLTATKWILLETVEIQIPFSRIKLINPDEK